ERHLPLQPLEIRLRHDEARNPEHDAVAEEDLAVGAADDRADAPAHERLWRVLARATAPEVLTDYQYCRALVDGLVERVLRVLLLRVLERVLADAREGHFLEEARGDDAIGVDVVAGHRDAAPRGLPSLEVGRAHERISLTSATAPVMAAAATM